MTPSIRLFVLSLGAFAAATAPAADWPAERGDASRSGTSPEQLSLPLFDHWTYQPLQPPAPAWPEPGKELHRIDFDYAFHPVVANGVVYFGSSADDTLRALSLHQGTLLWKFTAAGPIRLAPAVSGGKVYVASDDGYLYCLDAATGAQVWRFRAAGHNDLLLGNGRMISRWPLRSGVLVDHGIAYVCAGMWPTEGIHLYALNAETGKIVWANHESGSTYMDLPHRTSSAFTGVSAQGYMAASKELLLVPTGRGVPAAFERATGRLRYYQPSRTQFAGGAWTAIAGDIFLNPVHPHQSDDEAFVGEAAPRAGDGMGLYSLDDGLAGTTLPGCLQVAVTENVLYAGGDEYVAAIDRARLRGGRKFEDALLWRVKHDRAYSVLLAGQTLFVGTRGAITAFAADTGKQVWTTAFDDRVRSLAISDGRLLAAGQSGKIVCYTHQEGAITPATRKAEKSAWSTHLATAHLKQAAAIAAASGVTKGYALVLGEPDSRLAAALAARTELRVIAVLTNEVAARAERQWLVENGLAGARVSIVTPEVPTRLPCASFFANLVLLTHPTPHDGRELQRMVKPCGGVFCAIDTARDSLPRLAQEAGLFNTGIRRLPGIATVTRGPLAGGGEWRWELANPGRTAIGDESLLTLPLELLWFGGPGPDRMMDRHWRTASPLYVDGRMFVKGQHHVLAFDAYNGRELWCTEVRGVGTPQSWWAAGSFTADDCSLFVACGKGCLRLDQATGRILGTYPIPPDAAEEEKPAPRQLDVTWPTSWQVFGPFAKDAPVATRAALQTIPTELAVGGRTCMPTTLQAVDGMLDLTYLYGGYGFKSLLPGEKAGPYRGEGVKEEANAGRVAYAFTKVNCPQDGQLTIGAGADWWMQWFVDGKTVYDTVSRGNIFFPYAATNHTFTVDLTAGEHVVCAMVKAGSLSWCLASDGGARFARQIPPMPEERRPHSWAWVGVVDDQILGVRFSTGGAGKRLFALGRDDGRLRWIYEARRGLLGECIAIGDGRVYLADATSTPEAAAARRRGEKLIPGRTLLALDLHTGRELWQKELSGYSLAYWRIRAVQFARGVVVVDGSAAFDAGTGSNLWQRTIFTDRSTLIHGDTVIDWPAVFDLRTGIPEETEDILGRGRFPQRFPHAYGCGEITGSANQLFFRSGMTGVYDFEAGGTTTFGGVRPGCSANTIPAGGLLNCPEGSSGCSCSYNFQTSLALAPAEQPRDVWYTFSGESSTAAITRLALNFGAPGDRRSNAGIPWLAWPRPEMPGSCPVAAGMITGAAAPWYRYDRAASIQGTDTPWVYTSGLSATGTWTVLLRNLAPVVVDACAQAPIVDGKLDDRCWPAAAPIPFDSLVNLRDPRVELRACRDATNLYFACRIRAEVRDGQPVPFVAMQTGTNANLQRDDACQFTFSDQGATQMVSLGITCGGATTATTRDLWIDEYKPDAPWGGAWRSAVDRKPDEWTAEASVSLAALAQAGLNTNTLQMNFYSQQVALSWRNQKFLVDPGFSNPVFLRPIAASAPVGAPRRYTVRLHFAEPDDVAPGARVFDVALQGKRVLQNLDIVKEAGAPRTALVKIVPGVELGEELRLTLTPAAVTTLPPIICALEAAAEQTSPGLRIAR